MKKLVICVFLIVSLTSLVLAVENDYKFTGKPLDSESGLYYYGARYYNPSIGRFTTPDALRGDLRNPLSFNRYVYVQNNPLKYIDPSGNSANEAITTTRVVTEFTIEYFLGPSQVSIPRSVGIGGALGAFGLIASILIPTSPLGTDDTPLTSDAGRARRAGVQETINRYNEIGSIIEGDEEAEKQLKKTVEAAKEYIAYRNDMGNSIAVSRFRDGEKSPKFIERTKKLEQGRSDKHNQLVKEFNLIEHVLRSFYSHVPEAEGGFLKNPEADRTEVEKWAEELVEGLGETP